MPVERRMPIKPASSHRNWKHLPVVGAGPSLMMRKQFNAWSMIFIFVLGGIIGAMVF